MEGYMLENAFRDRSRVERDYGDFYYAHYRNILQDIRCGIYDRVYELESAADSFLRDQRITRSQLKHWIAMYDQRKDYWSSVCRVRQAIATVRRGRVRVYDLAIIDAFVREYGTDQLVLFFRVELDEYQSWVPLEPSEER